MKFAAGAKAEELFEKQASEHGFIPVRLPQDQDSFAPYTSGSKGMPVKRGDFLLRAVNNIEIEVKCLSLYPLYGLPNFFYVESSHIERHKEMQKLTGVPVVLAIYERCGDAPKVDSLRMIRIQTILDAENNKESFMDRKMSLMDSGEEKECFVFHESMAEKGFSLIDEERKSIERSNAVAR